MRALMELIHPACVPLSSGPSEEQLGKKPPMSETRAHTDEQHRHGFVVKR